MWPEFLWEQRISVNYNFALKSLFLLEIFSFDQSRQFSSKLVLLENHKVIHQKRSFLYEVIKLASLCLGLPRRPLVNSRLVCSCGDRFWHTRAVAGHETHKRWVLDFTYVNSKIANFSREERTFERAYGRKYFGYLKLFKTVHGCCFDWEHISLAQAFIVGWFCNIIEELFCSNMPRPLLKACSGALVLNPVPSFPPTTCLSTSIQLHWQRLITFNKSGSSKTNPPKHRNQKKVSVKRDTKNYRMRFHTSRHLQQAQTEKTIPSKVSQAPAWIFGFRLMSVRIQIIFIEKKVA